MENASKALIIAGGILASIIILGILVMVWTNVSNFQANVEDSKKQDQLTAFNKEYESYQKQLLRGADVASIVNKVNNDNINLNDNDIKITCEIYILKDVKASGEKFLSIARYTQDSTEIKAMISEKESKNVEQLKVFKRLYFKCELIGYDNRTGRVNLIRFKQIPSEMVNEFFNN